MSCSTSYQQRRQILGQGSIVENNTGTNEGTTAAAELPKDCPDPLICVEGISEINTQMTVARPMACDVMNRNNRTGTKCPPTTKEKC